MDETWIHHFTSESNQQLAEWTAAGKSRPKRPKMQTSTGKVLASIFCDTHSILFINYFINSKYYIALLVHLKEQITKKQPQMKKKKDLFHQDNAPCHKLIATMAKLHELHIKLLPHPLNSPDLAPKWLLAVCRPQKNAPGKEIWLQWRSNIGNRGQRQIIPQKRYWIVRSVEIRVSPSKETMMMNKVEFCLKVVVLLVRFETYGVMCYFMLST